MDGWLLKSWWVFGTRGLLALTFGVVALAWLDMSPVMLATLYAAYTLSSALLWLVRATTQVKAAKTWLSLCAAIVGIVAAGAAYDARLDPAKLMLVIGSTELILGVCDMVLACRRREMIEGDWSLVLAGCFSSAVGILLLLVSAEPVRTLAMLGVFATLTGAMLLQLGFRLRFSTRAATAPAAAIEEADVALDLHSARWDVRAEQEEGDRSSLCRPPRRRSVARLLLSDERPRDNARARIMT